MLSRDRASEVINIAARYPEGYEGLSVLEYEISSKIWQLANEKPKLGLCGYLSSMPPPNPMMMGRQQPRPEFSGLRRVLGDAFDIEEIDLKQEEPDPEKMPLLLVVRPKEFSDVEVFRLDQYLVKGGRVLMLVTQGTIQPGFPPPGSRQEGLFRYEPFKTGLDEWLAHHGVRVPNEFVLHQFNALPIRVYTTKEIPGLGQARGLFPEANWFWPTFGAEGAIDPDNPAMQTLKVVHLFWPHPVDVLEDKLGGKAATVLLESHEDESWRWKELTRVDRRHLDSEADSPDPTAYRASSVAVAIEGTFTSYFADKSTPPSLTQASDEEETPRNDDEPGDEPTEGDEPGDEPTEGDEPGDEPTEGAEPGDEPTEGAEEGAAEGEEKEEGEDKKEEAKPSGPEVVKTSAEPTQLVIVGNAFFVSDMVLGGQSSEDSARLAGLLAFNLVDWLARSKDLIALRAKRYARRALLDPDFDADRESLNESFEKGEISIDEYKREADVLRERQKNRWKSWRWRNVLWPAILTLLIGALVWILRAAARARRAIVPRAVPPASLDDDDEFVSEE
jgi:hypothetical protein